MPTCSPQEIIQAIDEALRAIEAFNPSWDQEHYALDEKRRKLLRFADVGDRLDVFQTHASASTEALISATPARKPHVLQLGFTAPVIAYKLALLAYIAIRKE